MENEPPEASKFTRRTFLIGGASTAAVGGIGFLLGRISDGSGQPSVNAHQLVDHNTDFLTRTINEREAVEPDGIFHVATTSSMVALTFDDGPDPIHTPLILDMLDKYNAKATFFQVGVNALAHPDVIKEVLDRGHSVGNHTYSHPNLELLDAKHVSDEIDRGEAALIKAGAPRTKLFRPPKGFTDQTVNILAEASRYRTVFWGFCLEHYVDKEPIGYGVTKMLAGIKKGDILLAHDGWHIEGPGKPYLNRKRTMQALPKLLRGLQQMDLQIVDVPTLLANRQPSSERVGS